MSYSKLVMQRRKKKEHSHFQDVDMVALNPPREPKDQEPAGHSGGYVPTVRPGQAFIQRKLSSDIVLGDSSDPFAPKISANSMQKLLELIEAQKNFLRYYEHKEKMDPRRRVDSAFTQYKTNTTANQSDQGLFPEATILRRREQSDRPRVREDDRPQVTRSASNTDSDKENLTETQRRQRKVVHLVSSSSSSENSVDISSKRSGRSSSNRVILEMEQQNRDTAPSLKRKTDGDMGNNGGPVPEKVHKHIATEGLVVNVDSGTQTDTTRQPRVISSGRRKRVVAVVQRPEERQKAIPAAVAKEKLKPVVDKPWRENMRVRLAEKEDDVAKRAEEEEEEEEPAAEPKKATVDKPWRVNMKPSSVTVATVNGIVATAVVTAADAGVENGPAGKKVDDKPWRNNMKKAGPATVNQPSSVQVVKKRHFNRDEVKKYMLEKRRRDRAAREAEEKEERLRQEMIKIRLEELDKLQKQIAETDLTAPRRWEEEEGEQLMAEEAVVDQERLREKLIELTDQMKERWRVEQVREEVLGKDNVVSEVNIDLRTSPQHKVARKEKINNIAAEFTVKTKNSSTIRSNHTLLGHETLSDTDATEIRSLPDTSGTSKGSKNYRESFRDYREKSLGDSSSSPQAPQPLTDQIPERDLSDAQNTSRKSSKKQERNSQKTDRSSQKTDNTTQQTEKNYSQRERSIQKSDQFSQKSNRRLEREKSIYSSDGLDIDKGSDAQPRLEAGMGFTHQETRTRAMPATLTRAIPETLTRAIPETHTRAIPDTHTRTIPETRTRAIPEERLGEDMCDSVFIPKFPEILCRGKELDNEVPRDIPSDFGPPDLLPEQFSATQYRNISLPKPVPRLSELRSLGSQETINSEQPPQWIEVTKDSSGTDLDDAVFRPSDHPYHPVDPSRQGPEEQGRAAPDHTNVINTVLRKLASFDNETRNNERAVTPKIVEQEKPVDLNISSGLLSPSPESSPVSQYSGIPAGISNLKKNEKLLTEKKRLAESRKTSIQELEDTDSASTMRDVEDNLTVESSRSLARTRGSKSRERSPRKRSISKSRSAPRASMRSTETQFSPSHNIGVVGLDGSVIPTALHLRFMTELNQLESVNATEKLLAELEQIKNSAFQNQQSLQDVHLEIMAQRQKEEERRNAELLGQAEKELQEQYASKLRQLLESQNEVTRVTSDAAKQMAATAASVGRVVEAPPRTSDTAPVVGDRDSVLVTVLTKLQESIENLSRNGGDKASSVYTSRQSTTTERSRSPETTRNTVSHITQTESIVESGVSHSVLTNTARYTDQTVGTVEEASNMGQDVPDSGAAGTVSSSIAVEASVLLSKSSSSILDLIDEHKKQEFSIQQTISEALASISECENKTKSNITAEVEDELSTDYSSQFEEDSTLKEKSSQVVSGEVNRRKGEKKKSKKGGEYSSDASGSSTATSVWESDPDLGGISSGSLFSENDSFTKFTLEMVHQYMYEENARANHKEALLKLKEKSLIEKAKKEIEALDKIKENYVAKGTEDKVGKVKKKQREILLKLKERQKEISRMRETLKIAERERKFLIQQQKRLLKAKGRKREAAVGIDSTLDESMQSGKEGEYHPSDSEDKTALSKRSEAKRGMKKVDKRDRTAAAGKTIGKAMKVIPSTESITEDLSTVDTDHDRTELHESHMDNDSLVKPTLTSKGKVEKGRVSPLKFQSRHRHSSADSEGETPNYSLVETASDQSDIEARIAALHEQLQNRIKTAAKLKKEQRRDKREKLKSQEITLKKQIEVYDKLISEGLTEIQPAADGSEPASFSRPKIRSPRRSLSDRRSSLSRDLSDKLDDSSRSLVHTPDLASLSQSVLSDEHSRDSDSSHKSVSHEGSTSTILASPVKGVSPDIFLPDKETPVSLQLISEVIEEALDSLSADEGSKTEEKREEDEAVPEREDRFLTQESRESAISEKSDDYSVSFEVSSSKHEHQSEDVEEDEEEEEEETPVESVSESSSSVLDNKLRVEAQQLSEANEATIVPDPTDSPAPPQSDQSAVGTKKITESVVDSIANKIWMDLLLDASQTVMPLVRKSTITRSSSTTTTNNKPVSPSVSPTKTRAISPVSPRSKPQDLMLTTFDISSESSDDSPTTKAPISVDVDEEPLAGASNDEDDFFDDDFGLSAIRQEAEQLRIQQLKVEEEIAKIQGVEKEAVTIRQIPDKPPPPYVPPVVPAAVSKPSRPPPPKHFIPVSRPKVEALITQLVKHVYEARQSSADDSYSGAEFRPDLLGESRADLNETEQAAMEQYGRMLHELVVEKVATAFRPETLGQNPPWMAPKPLKKLQFLMPKTLEALTETVKKEILSDFKLEKKVQRESLFIRWAGKKRDRVDDILVRELQEEESLWTDFGEDEVVVKDQIVGGIFNNMVTETIQIFKHIYARKQQRAAAASKH